MAARMKIIEIAGQRLHTAKIIRHGLQREFTHARIRRAGVERIGRMGKDLSLIHILNKIIIQTAIHRADLCPVQYGLMQPFRLHQTLTFLFRQFPQQLDLPRVALVLMRRF